jgi:threonine dehydrogenase-like Zn-dependent dehydrogenase
VRVPAADAPDLVLDAVGAQATRSAGLDILRPGGTMVCIGLAADETTLGFHGVVRNQHRIQGSYAYTMADYEQAHAWLVSGQASLGDELTDVLPLDAGPEQFARLAEGPPAEFKVFLAGTGRES